MNNSESETLAERVRIIEDNSRKNNVIFNGIPEAVTETPEHLLENVGQILTRKLNVANDVEYCHHLGGEIDSGRPRAVLVKLKNSAVQRSCLRVSYKLMGSSIFVTDDVSKATQEIRKSKMGELLEKRRQGLIAYFSGTKIVTKKGTPYSHQ